LNVSNGTLWPYKKLHVHILPVSALTDWETTRVYSRLPHLPLSEG